MIENITATSIFNLYKCNGGNMLVGSECKDIEHAQSEVKTVIYSVSFLIWLAFATQGLPGFAALVALTVFVILTNKYCRKI